eukprot:358374-Chlamydomonas_euryale.AAC.7
MRAYTRNGLGRLPYGRTDQKKQKTPYSNTSAVRTCPTCGATVENFQSSGRLDESRALHITG